MRIDLGLILAILLEYVLFIYYADTLFYRRKKKYICRIISFIGYTIHFCVCILGHMSLNIAVFIIINFAALMLCYHINLKNALFQSAVLAVLSAASELCVAFLGILGINLNDISAMSGMQSIFLTLMSGLFYLIGIMILINVFTKRKSSSDIPSAELILISVLTLAITVLVLKNSVKTQEVSLIFFLLVAVDVMVFHINQHLIIKNTETEALRAQKLKDKISFEEYKLLKENNERMRELRHDFKEHINTLAALIDEDNKKAKRYIQSISDEEEKFLCEEYTNNKTLNIILSKKKTEGSECGIKFIIDPNSANLNFISDMDIVTIFSNLINNAMESCARSKAKKIFLNIDSINDNFVVVTIENSCDEAPIVTDGKLKTHKANKAIHGIGISSVKRALKNYGGTLNWEYDSDEKIFSAKIIMKNIPKK